MVKEILKRKKKCYECEECNLVYKDKEWAKKCEDYCKTYKACNIDIIRHVVN